VLASRMSASVKCLSNSSSSSAMLNSPTCNSAGTSACLLSCSAATGSALFPFRLPIELSPSTLFFDGGLPNLRAPLGLFSEGFLSTISALLFLLSAAFGESAVPPPSLTRPFFVCLPSFVRSCDAPRASRFPSRGPRARGTPISCLWRSRYHPRDAAGRNRLRIGLSPRHETGGRNQLPKRSDALGREQTTAPIL
jgi:hypothetical protein